MLLSSREVAQPAKAHSTAATPMSLLTFIIAYSYHL
jgi:hypothetical protein